MKDLNSDLSVFNFEGAEVRTLAVKGEPWFVAKDICAVLGMKNSRQALKHVDDDEKGVTLNDTLGGMQEFSTVNESGMYALVMRSRKPHAKMFRKWVTSEVLPTIRKTGGVFMTDDALEKTFNDPDYMMGVIGKLKEVQIERDEARRTKACISAGKTASAMGTASGAVRRLNKSTKENKELTAKNEWLGLQVRLENEKSNQRCSRMAFKANRKSYCAHCDKLIRYGTYAFGFPNGGNGFRGVVHQNCNESYIATKAVEKLKNDR